MKYRNPERMAWLVILGAFVAFLFLCATIPVGLRYYLEHATASQTATLEVIDGTPRYRVPGAVAPIAATRTVQLPEGTSIETDENSRGSISFYDGSTAILFPSTQIILGQMRVPAFPWGIEPITLQLEETRGHLRVGAAALFPQGANPAPVRSFQIRTPHFTGFLAEGSYVIELLGTDTSQIIVNAGSAAVTSQGQTVQVGPRQRTVSTPGQPPLPPLPAAQDFIVNGDFKDPLPRGWNIVRTPDNDPRVQLGAVTPEVQGEPRVVHITRSGSNQGGVVTSADTGIIQQINREVSDYHTMQLSADIRVHNQSLSGGGVLSSEYPLILRIRYRDVYGSPAEWVHGFYIQNSTNNPTNNGQLITQDVPFPYESENLFDVLDPKPFYITSVQIYASGWDYDSYVSGVRLVVE
jgi:hypothetical protein